MAFLYYEGTKDYQVTTPALIVTLRASGSITAGHGLKWDAGNTSDAWDDSAGVSGMCAGIALATVATTDPCPVLVWGFVKNILSNGAVTPGQAIELSGSGPAFKAAATQAVSGSTFKSQYACGRVVSGSTSDVFWAFINTMG